MRKVSGFTLFEIMVTLAIAGIIAAFAVPAFQSVLSSSRLNAASQEVANSVALARNTAIARRRNVVLKPQVASTPTWAIHLDSSVGPTLASHVLNSPLTLAPSVAFTEMTFQPNGYVRRTNGATTGPMDVDLVLCDSSTRKEVGRTVSITRVGRIRNTAHTSAATCNP